MNNHLIVIVDDDDNLNKQKEKEPATATAQIMEGSPIVEANAELPLPLPNNNQYGQGQIVINVLQNGDIQINNPDGKSCLVENQILQQENIDTNNLTNESLQSILQLASLPVPNKLTIIEDTNDHPQQILPKLTPPMDHSNYDHQQHEPPKLMAYSIATDEASRRKRRIKETFDPTVKSISSGIFENCKKSAFGHGHNLKFVPYNFKQAASNFSISVPSKSSNVLCGSSSQSDLIGQLITLPTIRGSGAVIYKPDHQPQNKNPNTQRLCCAYCHQFIPKPKLDYILIRLPVHADCIGTSATTAAHLVDYSDKVGNKE